MIPSLSQELELVLEEYSKQLHLRKIRDALSNLTIGNSYTNTNDINRLSLLLGVLYHKESSSVIFQTDIIEKRVANLIKFSSFSECNELITVSNMLIQLFKDFTNNRINSSGISITITIIIIIIIIMIYVDKIRVENIIISYKKLNLGNVKNLIYYYSY